jgi:hypothetical protein
VLAELGADPAVVEEKRIDPAQDFAWQAGPRGPRGPRAAASEGWEQAWLDEEVPALFGDTPREAARGLGGADPARVEALLRQFEYENDMLAREGAAGIDTAWLRAQLAMPSILDD